MSNPVAMRLKQLRDQAGWTFEAIAKKLGLPKSTYANYEYGTREPPLDIIAKLADLYYVSTDYLLKGAEADNSAPAEMLSERGKENLFDRITETIGLRFFREFAEMTPSDQIDIAQSLQVAFELTKRRRTQIAKDLKRTLERGSTKRFNPKA